MKFRTLQLGIQFTIIDELHHKSFYILTGIAVLFTLMLRGCFSGNYVVNGEQINGVTIGWHASLVGFQIIAFGGLLIAILLSMRSFMRDRESGMTVTILSKPVNRTEYVTSKIIGLWILSYGLVLILHTTVYFIMLFNTGGRLALFYPASLITSLNILSIVTIVLLLTMYVSDIVAALIGIVLAFGSLIIDSVYAASQTDIAQNVMHQTGTPPASTWWVWIVWPKIAAVQYFATSLIKQSPFHALGPVHPLVNILLWAAVSYVLLVLAFRKKEIG